MRTGIYVEKRTTVTIRASNPQDDRVQLRRFRVETCDADGRAVMREPDAVGTHQLDAGIYLIVSSSPMQIKGDDLTTQIAPNDKDTFPDPDVTVIGLVPGASAAMIQNFFAVTKGIEIGDPPPQPVSPTKQGTGEVTDEPDDI
ncbi:MAG TPA: hypothetical protein VHW23_09045 [Kofleriaceae bacterium]|jgi:hypothetical protein|nr:hypothetical protein [Kofleriaceae bacterium]